MKGQYNPSLSYLLPTKTKKLLEDLNLSGYTITSYGRSTARDNWRLAEQPYEAHKGDKTDETEHRAQLTRVCIVYSIKAVWQPDL